MMLITNPTKNRCKNPAVSSPAIASKSAAKKAGILAIKKQMPAIK